MSPYEEGAEAYWQGKNYNDNPYADGTRSARDWDDGHFDAFDADRFTEEQYS